MHDTHTINLYFHVDFCICNISTIPTTIVGLTHGRYNQLFDNYNISLLRSPTVYRLDVRNY